MYDYHIHSTFSPDSNMSLEEICKTAINLGFKEIAITDHVDKECPDGMIWDIDYDKYVSEIKNIRHKYYKNKLSVLLGVELGIQPKTITKLEKYLDDHKFDFIIASVHYPNGCGINDVNFYSDKTQKQAYMIYLENLLYIVKNYDKYNVVGHLDFVVRYGNYTDKRLSINEYGDIIDEILKIIIEKQRGIEINTSGYRYGLQSTHPDIEIIKRYKELGGEIITVGSDAHRVEYIGYKFKEIYEILKGLGFKYITTYKNLKPYFKKI